MINFFFKLDEQKKIDHHYQYKCIQGETRLGSRGNSDVLRMLFKPRNNIVTRSKPIPPPACGGAP